MHARISHFGGEVQEGVVLAVHDGGRRLDVRCGEELLEFVLSRASAQYLGSDSGVAARLELLPLRTYGR